MSDDKGGEYTKRLSQELRSTLYQRDLHNQMWNGDVPPPDLQVNFCPNECPGLCKHRPGHSLGKTTYKLWAHEFYKN